LGEKSPFSTQREGGAMVQEMEVESDFLRFERMPVMDPRKQRLVNARGSGPDRSG